MDRQEIAYDVDGTVLRGHAVLPEGDGRAPGVLVSHDWSGRNEMAERVAADLAGLGYVGFALDLYGEGRRGATKEEKSALMSPLLADRGQLMKRMTAGLEAMRGLDRVDPSRAAAIGFCFGGLCVLDLARSGADVRGVVSFHGLLGPPPPSLCRPIRAKVLVLHGYRDPMATPEQVAAFEREMAGAGADWQLHAHGIAMHAFMNPQANDPEAGTVYDETTALRAWASMRAFLGEIL